MSITPTNYANKYYTMTPNALAFDPKVSDKALRVWMALEDFSGANKTCWPGYDEIGRKVGCTGRWVAELVKELVAAGWVLVEYRQGKSNKYTLLNRVQRKEPTQEVRQVAPRNYASYKPYPTNNNQGKRGFQPPKNSLKAGAAAYIERELARREQKNI